jgi:urease subunit alpha
MVIKGGLINWAVMGDPNASVPTCEPQLYRPQFGALGPALSRTSITFLSQAGYDAGVHEELGLRRMVAPVRNCRAITKRDMVRNDRTPRIEVNPDTYEVRVDGELATVPPAERLSLAQKFFLV